MTVGQLVDFIRDNGLSKNAEVILPADAEGNSYEFLSDAGVVEDFEGVGYNEEIAAGRCLILWPDN